MTIPTRMVWLTVLFGLALCGCSDQSSDTPGTTLESRPNILLILGDDMGVETLASYRLGSTTPTTATLDDLARQGVQFNNFWSQPVCSPTRATIITGRYGFRTGVGRPLTAGGPAPEPPAKPAWAPYEVPGTGGGMGFGGSTDGLTLSYGLPGNEFTLPRALKSGAGPAYATAAIGKWHLGDAENGWTEHPNLVGFDHYEAVLRGIDSYFSWNKVVDGDYVGTTHYAATDRVDAAVEWISDRGDSPWFMWLGFTLPHTPLHLPPEELWQSDHSELDPNADPTENPLPYFHAMIEAMDSEIGRLLASIDPAVLDNTYVIFLGDNGTTSTTVTEPFQPGRAKGSVYQGGVNVPLIVTGPRVASGRSSDALINSTDLYATILEMAGLDARELTPSHVTLDSISLLPNLLEPDSPSRRQWVYADVFSGNFAGVEGADYAMRDERYKLLRRDGVLEFYDLMTDPFEHINLLDGTLSALQEERYQWLQARVTALRGSE